MTPRSLRIRPQAAKDLEQRATYLSQERGRHFAQTYIDNLLDWLESIAQSGASPGTFITADNSIKTLPYKRQATILAEYTPNELRIARVYFRGQNWQV